MTRSTTLPTVADGAALPGASGMELPEFLPDSTGPQAVERNPEGRFALYRVGDAVAGRNIHAAIYDSLRLGLAF